MAILMILATNVLTRKTCEYLLKAGHLTRKTVYESLGILLNNSLNIPLPCMIL